MKLYLSGPMSGKPNFNREAFAAAAEHLRQLGHDVINPAENDDVEAQQADVLDAGFEGVWRRCLLRDITQLFVDEFDAIVVLPDWETSRGARLEVHVGHALGLPMIEYEKAADTIGEATP